MERVGSSSPWRENRRRQRGYRPRALADRAAPPRVGPPGTEPCHGAPDEAIYSPTRPGAARGNPRPKRSLGHFLATARDWDSRYGKAPKTAAAHNSAREQISFFLNEVCQAEPGSPTDRLVAFSTWLITRPARSGPRGTWSGCTPQSARQYVASAAVALGWSYDEAAMEAHYTSARRRHLALHGPAGAPTKADMTADILRAIVGSTRFPLVATWAAGGAEGTPPGLGPKQAAGTAARRLWWARVLRPRSSRSTSAGAPAGRGLRMPR